MNLEYKGCEYKVEDVDEKGIVRFVASTADKVDFGEDLIPSGKSYLETVNSDYDKSRIKHFREHDSKIWVGFPTLSTSGNKLISTSQLMLKRDMGMDTFQLYKAAAEAGRMVEHSMGYRATDFHYEEIEGKQIRVIDNLIIREVSTLSAWGMNDEASEFDLKNMDIKKVLNELKFCEALLNADLNDVKLENIEQLKNKFDAELKLRQPKTIFDYLK